MLRYYLQLLCVISLRSHAEAFGIPGTTVSRPASRYIEERDEDGSAVRIPVEDIERTWTFNDYEAKGEFSVDLFVPENGNVKGCAFFMHGFSQYPIAYRKTLKEAAESTNVAIIAVETGVTSKIVLSDVVKKQTKTPQFALQRAVSEDTKQCISMVLDGNDVFAKYGVTKRAVGDRIAVMGHSMGGGLSFPVAADKNIDYVFAMAPVAGESVFDPVKEGVDVRTAKNSMLLAGSWDLIGRAKNVKKISSASNKKREESSVFVDIKQGLHTGFEDKVVLFGIPLFSSLGFLGIVLNILGFADVFIFQIVQRFLALLGINRKRTGQLAGTRALMDYFLSAMVAGEKVTLKNAEDYLEGRIKDSDVDNFDFQYPE